MLILLCFGTFIVYAYAQCDLFEEATSLHCVAPLVEYADLQSNILHPPLSGIEDLCNDYQKYLMCTAGVRPNCRMSRAPNIERMYEMMCEEKYLSIVREEKECLVKLERDSTLKECFVNKTNTLRDDDPSMYNVSQPSYECIVIQAYVDCLLERPHDICSDAVKIEVSLLSLLATRDGSDCTLITRPVVKSRPPPEEPIEVCPENGNACNCRLEGYAYDTLKKKCIDVDECSSGLAECSQHCTNLPGSFICSCDERFYALTENNATCERKDLDNLWLFFAHGKSIWNISTDGKTFQLQKAGLDKTAMIDIDVKERRLYYADIGSNVVERMNIDGTFPQAVQRYDVDGMEGVAVEWIGRNLYSVRRSDILVQALDGRFRKTLYKGVMSLPRAIVVYPSEGLMFVSDWSSSAFIAYAALDGSAFKKIITDRITWPNALAVDIYAKKLYWADAFLDVIECSNLDGSGRRLIISDSGSVPHVFSIAVADDFLYWTDWTYRGILRANKLTGQNITVLAQTALLPYSLKIFHPALQPQESSPCLTKACGQLCLLGENDTAICACGDGFELIQDGRSCASNCTDNQIECGGADDPKCISKLYLCDGIPHCSNKADEMNCPPRICLPGQFQCHDNTKCLPPGGLCDGIAQCLDSSDELYCPSLLTISKQ